ncbi:hypothetical protein OJAV_G00114090 [Oryzias javanicus]|uniref:Receptor ligand binding region domain-containing protein n=1 Tax=Oryzias javanicus TaxID=123683 RepID=A0A3S2PHZ0_ORYJA|nr:hypothetical protein OJAV_G00114090 [Oryzias javanicus]
MKLREATRPALVIMASWFFTVLLFQLAEASLSSDNATGDLQNVTLAAILPLTNTDYPWAWPRVAPALYRAVNSVNSDPHLLPGLKLQLVHGSSENREGFCSDSAAPLVAVDLKLSHDPWAFIGPGCDYSSSPVARFTTHWDVPMVTAGARADGFSTFAAVTNTGPTHKKLGELSLKIQETFGWNRHAMLIFSDNKDDNDERTCYFAVEGLYTLLKKHNITVFDYFIESDVNYKDVVQIIQKNGRVVYLCCSWDNLRNLMVQFWKEGVDLENYVFFFIDLFAEGLGGEQPVTPWFRGDQDDYAAQQAFRSVKVLTYLEPQNAEYHQFVETLKKDAEKMFNFTIKDSLYNLIAGGFYDGVMLYSQALNETLSKHKPGQRPVPRPKGDMVTQRMWNRTFRGVMGTVEMDEFGDREIDFALWDMTERRNLKTLWNSIKQLVLQKGLDFQWPGGSPPLEVPECGFKNDNPACLTRTVTMHQMVAIVICFVFVIIVTITIFIYRKLKLESELAAQLWRVSWDDIQMSNLDKVLRRACSRLTMSLKGSNYGSLMTMEGNLQIYTKTGYYKGNLVAIKYINKKRIELTRNVLFELKHMRDVHNEHLTASSAPALTPQTCASSPSTAPEAAFRT